MPLLKVFEPIRLGPIEVPNRIVRTAHSGGMGQDGRMGEGLIAYRDNPAHQRAKLMALTEAGRVALSDIQGRQAKWADRHGGEFGEQRLREATGVIAEVLASLSGKQQA